MSLKCWTFKIVKKWFRFICMYTLMVSWISYFWFSIWPKLNVPYDSDKRTYFKLFVCSKHTFCMSHWQKHSTASFSCPPPRLHHSHVPPNTSSVLSHFLRVLQQSTVNYLVIKIFVSQYCQTFQMPLLDKVKRVFYCSHSPVTSLAKVVLDVLF